MLIPGAAIFIVCFPVRTGVLRFFVCVSSGPNCSTQGSTGNCTIAAADLIANCCASSTANATTNGSIQCGAIRVRFKNHQCRH